LFINFVAKFDRKVRATWGKGTLQYLSKFRLYRAFFTFGHLAISCMEKN